MNGAIGSDRMDKLDKNTTHSIPRRISPDGNSSYSTLQDLIDKPPKGGAITGIMCATMALLVGEEFAEKTEGDDESKFRYGDNVGVWALAPSLFYAAGILHPGECISKEKLSGFINHKLISTGYEKIISSKPIEICDLFIDILKD
jgi:hypothetical protein